MILEDQAGNRSFLGASDFAALGISASVEVISSGDITPPASPTNLTASAGDGQITLAWSPNTEVDFLRYRIYGGTAANPATALDSTAAIGDTSQTFTGLVNGMTYYYRVTAVDEALNESDYSNEASATPFNDPPMAMADSVTTSEDTALTIFVLVNDADTDGDTLTVVTVTQPAQGAAAIDAGDTTLTYTPNADFWGLDSLTYTVSDGQGGLDTATVLVTVASVNDLPIATADSVTTSEDTALTIFVLENDADPDADKLTIANITQPAHGVAVIDPGDTTLTYTPAHNYWGLDSLAYTVSDGQSGRDTATVVVTVIPVNDPPVAAANTVITQEDSAVTILVLANDSDADGESLTIASVTQPAHGAAAIDPGDTTLTYTPNTDFWGLDSLTYTVSDGQSGRDTATVVVTVISVNDPPVAVADTVTTPEDTAVTVLVLTNDSDADGDTLTIASVTQPAHGAAAIDAGDTTLTYTPNADFWGLDSFTYALSDGQSGLDTATVLVTVNSVNDPPEAFLLLSPGHDSTLVITNDNVESDTLIFSWKAATDADGDTVIYYGEYNDEMESTILALGVISGNEVRVPYSDLASIMATLGQLTVTGEWNIFATDDWVDTTWSTNGPFTLAVDVTTLDVLRLVVLPKEFALHPNYPNPFNPSTTLRFDLPEAAAIYLMVFDVLGREVARLVNGHLQAGYHRLRWNGKTSDGREVPTGIYIARLVTPEYTKSIKMVLLK